MGMNRIVQEDDSVQEKQAEKEKVSYWLEKLFNQERDAEQRYLQEQTILRATEEAGRSDAVKVHAAKTEGDRQAVANMVTNSNRILLKASAVFPWDFFPAHIVVEETRITIVHRQIFSSQVHSINIKDISNVFIDTGILFARLTIVSNTYEQNKIAINLLWKGEAIMIRRIIEGLRMFINKDIDTTRYTVPALVSKLKELSTTKIVL